MARLTLSLSWKEPVERWRCTIGLLFLSISGLKSCCCSLNKRYHCKDDSKCRSIDPLKGMLKRCQCCIPFEGSVLLTLSHVIVLICTLHMRHLFIRLFIHVVALSICMHDTPFYANDYIRVHYMLVCWSKRATDMYNNFGYTFLGALQYQHLEVHDLHSSYEASFYSSFYPCCCTC